MAVRTAHDWRQSRGTAAFRSRFARSPRLVKVSERGCFARNDAGFREIDKPRYVECRIMWSCVVATTRAPTVEVGGVRQCGST